jgi:hypothetical protein
MNLLLKDCLPHLKEIAQELGLRLNRANEFKQVRLIFFQRFFAHSDIPD